MPRLSTVASISTIAFSSIFLSGCATKGFVREQVAALGQQQATVNQQQDGRIDGVDQTAKDALNRATEAGKLAEGKFNYSVVLTDENVKFPVGKAALSPEAETALTQLADRLKSENKNVYLEIQGYTDNAGNADANLKLGEKRAEAAYRFLHSQGIAANRMATISYGEEHPLAENNSRDGRATNRRITVVVLN
jgi:outer membrane protein OmpA-like peptidoglycan-associated protein